SLVKNDVLAFVGRWHIQGRVDRALRFMVTTGQAEFATEIWLLITAQDNQTQLRALRVARRFRPGVLGPDATARLAALPTEQREVVASELIHHGDANAIEMVATYALTESDPEVLSEIIQALTFRQSGRWVQKLLEKAPEQVWTDLAKRGYGRELAGTAAGPRLQAELIKLTQQITNPNELLSNLLNGEVGSAFETEISKAIANPEFKADDRNAAYLLQELHKKAPQAVTSALVTRLRAGLAIPYGSESLLDNAPLSDDDNLTQALLKAGRPKGDEISLARLASAVVIKALLNELALRRQALNRSSSEQQRNEFYGLKDVIQATKPEPFAEALVTVGDTDEIKKIGLFAEVLAGHSHDHSGDPPKEIKSNTLTETVRAWAQKTLTDAMSGRERRSEVARAIGRLADPSLLGELVLLLDADIAGIAADRENALAARAKGQAIGVLTLYDTQYGQAFLAIGGAEVIKAMQDRLTA
ncbi:MAG: hypothetical protein JSR78_11035, partial [Proteobacteria bacterium]|nr:hypothetical protein [Pseudomonadota bacterium]